VKDYFRVTNLHLDGQEQFKDNDQLLIGTIYRSPNSSSVKQNLLQSIINKTTERKPSHFLLMGDFNYPDINWGLGTSPPDMRNPATRFLETLRDAYLHICISM